MMKTLHNLFCGCPDNGNQMYKRKLDDLLKKHTQSIKKSEFVTTAASSRYSSVFERIVWAAVEDTIPDRFLDCDFRIETANEECEESSDVPDSCPTDPSLKVTD